MTGQGGLVCVFFGNVFLTLSVDNLKGGNGAVTLSDVSINH